MQANTIKFWLLQLSLGLAAISCDKKDDGNPSTTKPNVSINDVTVVEGNQGKSDAMLTVSLSAVSSNNIILTYSTLDQTATGGQDYDKITNQSLTIPAGSQSANIIVKINGDRSVEPDETFEVVITNAINANLVKSRGVVTIQNDEIDDNTIHVPDAGYVTPESYEGYELVWHDEFRGDKVNKEFWTFEIGNNNGWGNNESQYYREENASIHDNEYLVITAKQEAFNNYDYTSTRMITKGKKEFTFGRVDIRAALPYGQGIWPALWTLGSDISSVGWPACGEIDIMEYLGHDLIRTHGTAHWGSSVANHKYRGSSILSGNEGNFHDAFHVFSILWQKDKIEWLVDDRKFFEITPSMMEGQPYPFNNPQFFIMNVAVGGNWPGYPDETTVFPQRMLVDYIRVFQEK